MGKQENEAENRVRECPVGGTKVIIHSSPPPLNTIDIRGALGPREIRIPASKGERLITVIIDHIVVIHTPIRGWTPSLLSLHLVGRALPARWHRDASTPSSRDPRRFPGTFTKFLAFTPVFTIRFVLSFGLLLLLVRIGWDVFHVSVTKKQLPKGEVEGSRCLSVVF